MADDFRDLPNSIDWANPFLTKVTHRRQPALGHVACVIAGELTPICPVLSDKKNGRLFAASNADDLARSIRWFIENPGEMETMGQFGQQLVLTSWKNDQQIDGLVRFYDGICDKSH